VADPLNVQFTATPVTGMAPLSVTFTDQSTVLDGVIRSWTWDFGDGVTSTLQNPIHQYSRGSTYDVQLTIRTDTYTKTLIKPASIQVGPPHCTVINYTYDSLYRLTQASSTGAMTTTFAYAYDPVGNRTTQTATITSTQVTNYVYDAANRLTSVNGQAYTWDDNGNLVNDGGKAYTYDQANRLKSVNGSGVAVTYAYNGDGARLKQIVNGIPTTYTLDLAAPLVQVLVAKDSSGDTRYLYGDTRIGEQQSGGWLYHLTDALGSVRQLVDNSGNVQLARGYTPYGEPLWLNGTASSRYAFTGEDYDPTVGLVFLRARYMQPRLGIFLARDPWSGDVKRPGSMNGWGYVEGNPITLSDPSGYQGMDPLGALYLVGCFNLHTATPGFLGGILPDSTTAKSAVATCRAAYNKANWNKSIYGFKLDQELPTRAHDLFGWFLFEWRGKYNTDRLFFDAEQPLTRELAKDSQLTFVRDKYYNNDPDVGGPTLYKFATGDFGLSLFESLETAGERSLSIGFFMGSFYYQVKTLPNDRIGFRIDNDTSLASGTHVVYRFEDEGFTDSVEQLINSDPSLGDKTLQELLRDTEHYHILSILSNKTGRTTGGQGGATLYQTYYWTEKRACNLLERWFGDPTADMQVWPWSDFESKTADPSGWPAQ
jgi:RHS repeat-associated protein